VPCEQFTRSTSAPAAITAATTDSSDVAGPIVATILVRATSRLSHTCAVDNADVTWPSGAPRKDELRAMLRAAHPWLDHEELGPRNVEAGECDRCGDEARLVLTCGPDGGRLGRACAIAQGVDAWCEGHESEAVAALHWLAGLPADADQAARLWWLATGEVRLSSAEQGVVAALEEHQWVGPAGRLPDRQHLADDE
jgi:hypothetical protein